MAKKKKDSQIKVPASEENEATKTKDIKSRRKPLVGNAVTREGKRKAARVKTIKALSDNWPSLLYTSEGMLEPGFEDSKEYLDKLKKIYKKAVQEIANSFIVTEPPSGDIDISTNITLSELALSGYVTLDWQHRIDIRKLIDFMGRYAEDKSRKRPLNIMMQADPGSGKSHFIKCMAKGLSKYNVGEVTFNMTAIESIDDFTKPLDAVRNLKVNDKLPLLFLDEFDADPKNYPILLPLLWDGELQVGHRDLKVGKVIIVLAGSSKNIEKAIGVAKGMHREIANGTDKIVDLLSRINGGEFTIPGLDYEDKDKNRKVDKVCLAVALLEQRFRKRLQFVTWPLLSFISQVRFRYGVRSIAHIIDLIPAQAGKSDTIRRSDLKLPLSTASVLKTSSLAYHIISEDGPAAVIDLWRQIKEHDVLVRVRREYRSTGVWKLLAECAGVEREEAE